MVAKKKKEDPENQEDFSLNDFTPEPESIFLTDRMFRYEPVSIPAKIISKNACPRCGFDPVIGRRCRKCGLRKG